MGNLYVLGQCTLSLVKEGPGEPRARRGETMKKLLGLSVLALTLVAVTGQKASAWTNFNFGVGLNLSWQAGNNSCCWGLWNNGPVGVEGAGPGYWGPQKPFGCCNGGNGGYPGCYGGAGFAGGYPYAQAQGTMPGVEPWVAPAPSTKEPSKEENSRAAGRVPYQTVAYGQYTYPAAGYTYGAYVPAYNYPQTYNWGPPASMNYGSYYQPVETYFQGW
jgi:hypothetical protein